MVSPNLSHEKKLCERNLLACMSLRNVFSPRLRHPPPKREPWHGLCPVLLIRSREQEDGRCRATLTARNVAIGCGMQSFASSAAAHCVPASVMITTLPVTRPSLSWNSKHKCNHLLSRDTEKGNEQRLGFARCRWGFAARQPSPAPCWPGGAACERASSISTASRFTGLTKCALKPASCERRRSSSCP